MAQDGIPEGQRGDNLMSVAQIYNEENGINWTNIEKALEAEGLMFESDPRLKRIMAKLLKIKNKQCKDEILLTTSEFMQVMSEEASLITQGLLSSLVLTDFEILVNNMSLLYNNIKDCSQGEVGKRGALYEVDGREWNVTLVSVQGQRASFGCKDVFTLDDLCGPLIQGLAYDLLGEEAMVKMPEDSPNWVPGRPPNSNFSRNNVSGGGAAGWYFTDIAMIMMCSAIKSTKIEAWSEPLKHDYVLSFFKGLCCGEDLRFSNASYSQAKGSDCKLQALAHLLKAFAKCRNQMDPIDSGLDLLLQLRCMEVTTDALAMMGAVLANGGTSPFENSEILSHTAVTHLLDTMYSAGLGCSSTLFAVEGGVPAVATESGAMLVVVPGVFGMGLYSPRVESGCSVRAFNFATELIKQYGFHPYCKLEKQVFLRKKGRSIKKEVVFELDKNWSIFNATARGDLLTLCKCVDGGTDLGKVLDPNGQTLLHVAAANGHLELTKYIFCKAPELLFSVDSWDRRPKIYAELSGQTAVVEHLNILETATRSSLLASSLDLNSV